MAETAIDGTAVKLMNPYLALHLSPSFARLRTTSSRDRAAGTSWNGDCNRFGHSHIGYRM